MAGTCTAILILLIVFVPKFGATQLVMLDVGQGDSILLKSKGKVMMIDTGNQDSMLKSRLAEQGIAHLDGILITHPDDDHCGSLDVIEQLVDVSKVYVAKDLPNCNEGNCQKLMSQIKKIVSNDKIEKLKVGDKINFGEIELNVVWPDAYKDNGGNCDSLTVMASIDLGNDGEVESRALLCGDAEKDEIKTMISKKRIGKLDIYKCGHHGSANAIEEKSARVICPKLSLISVGAKNRYGHPNSKTIEMLEKVGSVIYRTDKNGTITCTFRGSQIDVHTDK